MSDIRFTPARPRASHKSSSRWSRPPASAKLIALVSLLVVVATGLSSSAAIAASHHRAKHPRPAATVAASASPAAPQRCSTDPVAQATERRMYKKVLNRCKHRGRPTMPDATASAPAKPAPTTPAPTRPAATTPAPTKPAPTTPAPTTPAPTTPAPSTPPPAASGGTPTAATTGVPSGTSLQASKGDINVTKDGTVIEGKDISGNIWIDADNVTIRSSRVRGEGFAVIQVKDGSKNVTVQNCDIDGMGAQSGSMGVIGPVKVTGSDITGVENGVTPGSGSVVSGNYVHNLKSPGSPHYDGIQIDGGLSNITISGNAIDLREHDQTSAVMIDNYFGPISHVAVDGNLLQGAGYTVYSDGQFTGGSISGVSFTNNRLGKGQYGYASINHNTPVWSNNVDAATGKAVSP